MTAAVVVTVVTGVILSVMIGLKRGGFTAASLLLLGLVVGFGALAIIVARKSRSGLVEPRACPHCGGLISPNAPYCKHCRRELEG